MDKRRDPQEILRGFYAPPPPDGFTAAVLKKTTDAPACAPVPRRISLYAGAACFAAAALMVALSLSGAGDTLNQAAAKAVHKPTALIEQLNDSLLQFDLNAALHQAFHPPATKGE